LDLVGSKERDRKKDNGEQQNFSSASLIEEGCDIERMGET
jgi:hypothetical protein